MTTNDGGPGRWVHAAALGLVLLLAGCGAAGLTVLSSVSPPQQTPAACAASLLTGRLVADGRGGLGVDDGGSVWFVDWPAAVQVRIEPPAAILAVDGTVIVQEGDRVEVPGGEGGPGRWIACEDVPIRRLGG